MSTTTTHDDPAMRSAYGAVAAAGVVFSVGAAIVSGPRIGGSVFIGALVALANLWVLARSVRNLLSGGEAKNKSPWAIVAVAKFFVLLGVTYFLVGSGLISSLGLAVGFGALPMGICFSGLVGVRHGQETDHA